VAIAASVVALWASAPARAAGTDDLWEVTTQMTMEGMPAGMGMPAQTRQVCSAKEWTKPPVQSDRNCQFTDFQRTDTKATWKMTCEGMTGEGEITRTSPEAYKGWMKMSMPQGAMTMNLTGRRVGNCDAGEVKKTRDVQMAQIEAQSAAAQKMSADGMKQICSTGAESLDMVTHHGSEQLCISQGGFTAASYKAPLCAKLQTYAGFKIACHRDPSDAENSLSGLAKFCGTTAAAVSSAACPEAKKSEDFDTLGKCCPAEATAYANERCAGLSYSGAGAMGGFCAQFAKDLMNQPAAAPPAKKKAGKSGR
jgi:hypothetical protein